VRTEISVPNEESYHRALPDTSITDQTSMFLTQLNDSLTIVCIAWLTYSKLQERPESPGTSTTNQQQASMKPQLMVTKSMTP